MVGGLAGLIFFMIFGFLVALGSEGDETIKFPIKAIGVVLGILFLLVLMGGFEPLYDFLDKGGHLKMTGWNDRFKGYGG